MPNRYETVGLKKIEYQKIVKILDREPNDLELNMYGAMWSEHCSYKHSRILFRHFPTSGKRVLQGPGENAGIVDIGDNMAIAMKIESHNSPTAVNPYQGAATGVGGILRDIFAMGARPIAFLNSLRFGNIKESDNTKALLKGAVKGMADYTKALEVPTVGGEIYFNHTYEGNPLVNAMCLGLVEHDKIHRANASGVGNSVIYIGSATGMDGIGGASFSSATLEENSEGVCPVGDPELGKRVMEACLELLKTGSVVGLQDLGAAGLTSACSETATRGEGGMEIDVLRVPRKVEGMNPIEVMLSESQERMLLIVEKGREEQVNEMVKKWGLHSMVIGKVTNDGMLTVKEGDTIVAKIPSESLDSSGAPEYDTDYEQPQYIEEERVLDAKDILEPEDYNEVLLRLLASPNIANREWIYRQFDKEDTEYIEIKDGSDSSVLQIKGTNKGIALTTDCNSRYCYLNPRAGGKIAVTEAARNLVCSGAQPLVITDGLNFGVPDTLEGFWKMRECVLGISEACRELDTPVISGNVSLYNGNEERDIYSTPIIGMIGLIENIDKRISLGFKQKGDIIILLGETKDELGASEYIAELHGLEKGKVSNINFALERRLHKFILDANEKGFLQSAHDVAEGGLAVALAECAMQNGLGIEIGLDTELRSDTILFGETQSRFIITVKSENLDAVKGLMVENRIPNTILGSVKDENFEIDINGKEIINLSIKGMNRVWREAFRLLTR
ncbi:MAG TPA: phosphoribosylformylglycinamidine synthase subunit PurL [Clostridia bacterium]|nr:phosphoribosylformylglycinamidine synthase subunit PurL [Clostridia bacterium]